MIGIYKITNQVNGKSYIGQSINIQQRWKQHRTNAMVRDETLYKAFQKYGIEHFSFEIIEECSEQLLDDREQYYISYYNTYNNGYNMTRGGQLNKKTYNKEIFDLWDKGKSILEIANILNISRSMIWQRLQNYNNYSVIESNQRGGKQAYSTMIAKGTLPIHMQPKFIYQYDIWGNYIKTWSSAKEIHRELGIDNSLIGQVLSGKYLQAGGYQWKNKQDKADNIEHQIKLKFGIVQQNLSGQIVNLWSSLIDIEKNSIMKKSSISKCLNGHQKTAYGFLWRYDYTIWNGLPYERGVKNGANKSVENW